jgi:hypothetical protein
MKKLSSLLVLAIVVLTGCQRDRWETYTSEEGAFSVSLPGVPADTTTSLGSPVGEIMMHKFSLNQETALYEVTYSDYPDTLFEIQSVDDILNGLLYTYTADGRVPPLNVKIVSLGDYPGREIDILSPDNQLYMKIRAYMVGHRLYQATVITQKAHSLSVNVDKFLDSFQVTGHPELLIQDDSDADGLR